MYVCMYICMYVCMYVCMYICVCVCVCVRVRVCVCVCVQTLENHKAFSSWGNSPWTIVDLCVNFLSFTIAVRGYNGSGE